MLTIWSCLQGDNNEEFIVVKESDVLATVA